MEQGEQPHDGFVRMHAGVGGPASKELSLLGNGERLAGEPSAWCDRDRPGRVDEEDLVAASPPEELTQRAEAPSAHRWSGVEERFDIARLHDRPVVLGSVLNEEHGEIPNDGDRAFDGGVRSWMGACTASPLPATNEVITELFHGWAQRFGGALDPAASAAGSEPRGLVETEGELTLDEEVLEGAGQRSGGATGASCPFQQCLGVVGFAVA